MHWLRVFAERYSDKGDYTQALVKKTWPQFFLKWTDSGETDEITDWTDSNRPQFLLRQMAKSPDQTFSELLDLTLDSSDFRYRLLKRAGRGSEEDLRYLVDTVKLAIKQGDAAQIDIWFQTWIDDFIQKGNIKEFFLLPIRLYSALIEDPETPEALLSVFGQLEERLTEYFNKEAL